MAIPSSSLALAIAAGLLLVLIGFSFDRNLSESRIPILAVAGVSGRQQGALRKESLVARRQLGSNSSSAVSMSATTASTKCNGRVNLCAQRVNDVMFATLHNANNALLDGSWLLPNHKLSLRAALKGGYRGINMDIGVCGGEVALLHETCLGRTKVTLARMLQDIVDFLDEPENANEVLLLPTEFPDTGILGDNDPATIEGVDAIFQQVDGFKDKLYDHAATLASDPNAPWPTLQELIDRDQRILFFHYGATSCTPTVDFPPGWNPWFDYAIETIFNFPCAWSFWPKEEACAFNSRGLQGTREFFGVNVFVTPPLFGVWTPYFLVHRKEFLVRHLNACRDENDGLKVNALLVNFWKVGDVVEVVDGYNSGL